MYSFYHTEHTDMSPKMLHQTENFKNHYRLCTVCPPNQCLIRGSRTLEDEEKNTEGFFELFFRLNISDERQIYL